MFVIEKLGIELTKKFLELLNAKEDFKYLESIMEVEYIINMNDGLVYLEKDNKVILTFESKLHQVFFQDIFGMKGDARRNAFEDMLIEYRKKKKRN